MTLDFSNLSTYLFDIGFSLLTTVLLYLAVPVFLTFIKKKRFTRKKARIIAIINAVIIHIIFFMISIITYNGESTGNLSPAFIWGFVGYRILLRNEISPEEIDHGNNRNADDYVPQPRFVDTHQNNSHQSKKVLNQQIKNSGQFYLLDKIYNSNTSHSGLTYQEFEKVFFTIYNKISSLKDSYNILNFSKFEVLSSMYFVCEYNDTLPREVHEKMMNTVRTAISKLLCYENDDIDFEKIKKRVNLYRLVSNGILPLRTDFFLAEVNSSDYVLKSAVTLCNILINPKIIDDYNSPLLFTGLDNAFIYTNFCYSLTQLLSYLPYAIEKLKEYNDSIKK